MQMLSASDKVNSTVAKWGWEGDNGVLVRWEVKEILCVREKKDVFYYLKESHKVAKIPR